MDLFHLIYAVISTLGIFLLAMTYTYIDKLEKIGCACAEHKYKKFIKNYSIFAIVFLLVTIFLPPALVAKTIGMNVGIVYALVTVAYNIATIIFFILTLIYVRYLMKEKCKCSEDVRREILYIWSILEIIILSALIIPPVLMTIVGGSVALVSSTVSQGMKSAPSIREAAVNPMSSAAKLTKAVQKNLKKLAK